MGSGLLNWNIKPPEGLKIRLHIAAILEDFPPTHLESESHQTLLKRYTDQWDPISLIGMMSPQKG